MKSILLAIDAGSSSIRCTAYEYTGPSLSSSTNDVVDLEVPPSDSSPSPSLVNAIEGIHHTISMSAINPTTGNIRIDQVLSAIDECVDEVLCLLRMPPGSPSSEEDKSSSSTNNNEGSSSNEYQIVAIGFSTFVMNFVGVNEYGNPVGEVATCSYAVNREDVVNECQSLRENLGPDKLKSMYQRTGTPIHASYALPQLRAFYSNPNNREIAKQITKWSTISSICIHRWCGRPQHIEMPISFSEASWTGMLNFRTCSWDDEAVELFEKCKGIVQYSQYSPTQEDQQDDDHFGSDGIDLLPPLVDFNSALPFLRGGIPLYNYDGSANRYYDKWPELQSKTVRLFFGVGDGAAANVGSKCGEYASNDERRIAVTIGTSAAARVCLPLSLVSSSDDAPESPSLSVPPGLFCYRVHKDSVLLGGALTDGGSVVEWARSLFNLQSTESFESCLVGVANVYEKRLCSDTSEAKLKMIPFLTGERSTGYRDGAAGCISGISRSTTSVDIVSTCLESVVMRLTCILRLIKSVRSSDSEEKCILIASGGALERNPLWRQMLADCSSMDVVIDGDSSAGTSRGVAMLMASFLQQAGQGGKTFVHNTEHLLIKSNTKANANAKKRWGHAMEDQETLIEAVLGPSLFDDHLSKKQRIEEQPNDNI